MSQVEVLPAYCALDFNIVASPTRGDAFPSSLEKSSWPTLVDAPSAPEVLFANLPPLLEGHPDVHLRDGVMNASRLSAAHVVDSEKAFFVADLSQVYKQHKRWVSCLPEIQPHYAIKCNPDPYVLRLLASLGTGFDCASNAEINQVLNIGSIAPDRIIFANPCKTASFVRQAGRLGVDKMTFDNADELYKIARAHPRAKLVIRILTDDSKSLCAFGIKFGAPLVTVPGLLAKARELNLDVIGVSFHVGSGCYDPSAYTDAIMRSRAVFDMGREAGYNLTLLDVGGGFEDGLFEKTAPVLMAAIENYFPDRSNIRLIAEPGRFYVSNAFSLATNIIARRAPIVPNNAPLPEGAAPRVMYYINDGVYGAFNCILFDHQVLHPYVLSMNSSFHIPAGPTHAASVWGPTCDSIDCVSPSTLLPDNLQVGDWLGWKAMGAYTVCAASQFNGFEVSDVVYTSGMGVAGVEVRDLLKAFARTVEVQTN